MKKQILFLLAAASVTVMPALARQLSPEQALAAATSTTADNTAGRRIAASRPVLDKTITRDGLNTIYIFNNPNNGGFLILSADDAAAPVIGYSSTGNFPTTRLAPNVSAWLEGYSVEIAAASRAGINYKEAVAAGPATVRRAARSAIYPLVATRWNQDAPYNNLCPTIGSEHTATGCTATAVAQVMNFHRWPAKGTGTVSYTWERQGTTLSMNLGATTFDWNNMLKTYDSSATATQQNAVATLMKAAGYISEMNYGLASTGGSGASSYDSALGLVKYLGYDNGLNFQERDYYPLNEWTSMIYAELAARRPVVYSGFEMNGSGHAFVIDGYDKDDFFHVNWGWGGTSDGYFRLTALAPDSQGIGGSGQNYNNRQTALLGMRPAVSGSRPVITFYCTGDFATAQSSYPVNQYVEFTTTQGNKPFLNRSSAEATFEYGVKLTDAAGKVTYVSSDYELTLKPNYGYYSYDIAAKSFPKGTYTVTPAFLSNGKWQEIKTLMGHTRSLTLVNDGTTLRFTPVSPTANLKATDISATTIYNGYPCQVKATVTNTGNEFHGHLTALLLNTSGTVVASGTPLTIDIPAGSSIDFNAVTKFNSISSSTLAAGTYRVAIAIVEYPQDYSSSFSIKTIIGRGTTTSKVVTPPALSSNNPVTATNFKANNQALNSTSPVTVPQGLAISYDLKCTDGFYSGYAGCLIATLSGNRYTTIKTFGNTFVSLAKGQSATINMPVSLSDLDQGTTYHLFAWNFSGPGNAQITTSKPVLFRVGTATGVNTIEVDNASIVATEIYDMSGNLVSTDAGAVLPSGIYIVRTTMDNGLVFTAKVRR